MARRRTMTSSGASSNTAAPPSSSPPTPTRCLRRFGSATGRIHTTYNQVMTTTGRLNSQNPNLQNIPIRTERGQEIRKAFVPRGEGFVLLSADYSQIELRIIIAALSREPGLLEAFEAGLDIHTATAARGLWRRPGSRYAGDAPEGEDGQLRDRLRHFRLRPGAAAQHPPTRRRRDHRPIFQTISRHSQIHGRHHGLRPRAWLCGNRHGPEAISPGYPLLQQHHFARPPNATPSTPPSRARRPT